MNVYNDIDKLNFSAGSVTTVGTFDGLHAGHLQLINEMILQSKELGLPNILVTFYPHPRDVVSSDNKVKVLSTLEEKLIILESLGVDNVFVINFTKEFSQIPYEVFLEEYIIKKLNVKALIIGHDHRFGKNREGDAAKLQEYATKNYFKIISVSSQSVEEQVVSSTKIRHCLLNCDIELANKYLQKRYYIAGIVVKGSQRGRLLGFPTANIMPADEKLLPKTGVYAVSCKIEDKVYFGMMNIGNRPTFDLLIEPVIEINLFNFNADIYDKFAWVEIYKFIREEKKFNSKEELIQKLNSDKEEIEKYLSLNN